MRSPPVAEVGKNDTSIFWSFFMAMNLIEIKSLLQKLGNRYFCDDERDQLFLPCNCGGNKIHILLSLQVQVEGESEFLQLRSRDFPTLDREHPAAHAVLEEILAFNYGTRFVKIGVDAADGEILAFGDIWLADGVVTAGQMATVIKNFVQSVANAQDRVAATMATKKTSRDRERDRECDDFFQACVAEHEADVAAEAGPNNTQAEAA